LYRNYTYYFKYIFWILLYENSLETLGSAPPAGSTASAPYLGSLIFPSATSGTVVNSPTNVHSISLPPGIWIVFGNINYNNFAGDYAAASISTNSATLENACLTIMRYVGTIAHNINVSRSVTVTGTNQIVYLVGQASNAVATSSAYFYAVRIA